MRITILSSFLLGECSGQGVGKEATPPSQQDRTRGDHRQPSSTSLVSSPTIHPHHQDHHHHQWQKRMCILCRVALMNTKDHCWCCIVFSIAWLHQLQCLAAIWFATEEAAPQLKIWSSSPAEGNSWLQKAIGKEFFLWGRCEASHGYFTIYCPYEHGKKCKKVVPYGKAGSYWLREIWCWDYILYSF